MGLNITMSTDLDYERQGSFTALDYRMSRVMAADCRALIVPLDHATTSGPIGGLRKPRSIIAAAAAGGADAVMLRPSMVGALSARGSAGLGIIMALTGRLISGEDHVVMNSVEHATASGADAICGEFKFGSDGDLENVRLISGLAEQAHRYNLPVLITVYTLPQLVAERGGRAYAHGCRIAEEIGADLIKTALPADDEIIADCVSGVSVPIVLAGGDPRTETGLLDESLRHAIHLGVAGAAVGRNAWMSGDLQANIRRLSDAIHRAE